MKAGFMVTALAAAVLFSSALAQEESYQYWYKRGMDLGNNGSYEEAINAYQKSIEMNGSYAPARTAKGALLFQLGRKDEAKLAFQGAIDVYNETLMKNPKDANAWIEKGVAYTYLGLNNESLKSREKALQIFNQTIEENPDDARAWSNKAFALMGMGRYGESVVALDRVLQLTDNSTLALDTWKGKAVAYAEGLQEYNKSQEAWDRALEMMPANDTANRSLTWGCKARTFDMMGRFEDAAAAYQRVIEISPADDRAMIGNAWIGKGFSLKSLGRSAEAEAAFDEAINASGSVYWLPWSGKGEVLLAQKKYEAAIRAFDRVIDLNPTYAKAWNERGAALKALGRQSEADAAFAKAKELGYQG